MPDIAPKELGHGERILEILVNYEDDGLYSGSTWTGDIIKKLDWARDGRSVARPLRKLEEAGLIERDDHPGLKKDHWRPTARGRWVDATLREITSVRGGKFRGRGESGIDFYESSALR